MRRGGTLHPPRPRVPAATRQAPPFLSSERQVFHTDSRDLKDQGFGAGQGLPRKEGNLWRKGEGRQTVRRDERSRRSCGKLKEPSQGRGPERQP